MLLLVGMQPWDAHGGKEDGGRFDGSAVSDGGSARGNGGAVLGRMVGGPEGLWPLARGIERERVYVRGAAVEGQVQERSLAEPLATVPAIPEAGAGAVDGRIEALICSVSWPCAEALAVAWCESRFDPLAESAGGHRGLFQLSSVHAEKFARRGWTWADAFDAERNVAIAYEIWLDSSWSPWACAR